MPWDPGLLRKYCTTGHFRLLNQLRGELRSNPMQRSKQAASSGARSENRPPETRSKERTVEVRPRSGGTSGRFRRPLQSAGPKGTRKPSGEDDQALNNASFRERLNAVDMR